MSQLLPPTLDLRLTRLEENSYFQEERLKALDSQILAQQKELDRLSGIVKCIERRLNVLEIAVGEAASKTGAGSDVEVPPHYSQKPL